MKTGIELIAEERREQPTKHGRTIKYDVENNKRQQLTDAATRLINGGCMPHPKDWSWDIWYKMISKARKERLIIAGALIAAEIDRIQYSKS